MAVRNAAAESGTYPLIIFSHPSGGHRRSATFLSTHLSSHGFVVAAVDHSEVVAQELARKEGETEEQKTARWQAVIAARVPDIRILLDQLLNDAAWAPEGRVPLAVEIERHSSGLHHRTSLGAVTEAAAGYWDTIHSAIRATTACSIPL
jgi:predicted dienelactone hydrolase